MKYTKEEQQQIRDAYNVILEDMNDLWEKAGNPEFNLQISLPQMGKFFPSYPASSWYLFFDKKGIYLENYTYLDKINLYLQKNTLIGKPIKHLKHCEAGAVLIQEYPEIREKLIFKLADINYNRQLSDEKKERQLLEINRIRDLYAKEIHVEISNPHGLNQNGIEITEEDGKKIGTLHIGPTTVRVITHSKIIFQDKSQEESKVKRK